MYLAQHRDVLMSALRSLAANGHVARHLPKFEDDRKVKWTMIFRGQVPRLRRDARRDHAEMHAEMHAGMHAGSSTGPVRSRRTC